MRPQTGVPNPARVVPGRRALRCQVERLGGFLAPAGLRPARAQAVPSLCPPQRGADANQVQVRPDRRSAVLLARLRRRRGIRRGGSETGHHRLLRVPPVRLRPDPVLHDAGHPDDHPGRQGHQEVRQPLLRSPGHPGEFPGHDARLLRPLGAADPRGADRQLGRDRPSVLRLRGLDGGLVPGVLVRLPEGNSTEGGRHCPGA
mmetsp:Transcript_42484/g.118282  ORF Transcript_42484/g.118282 Transcript_42484/m.118282 type:complete len:202 (-) Transcript_42484:458-1063(-)